MAARKSTVAAPVVPSFPRVKDEGYIDYSKRVRAAGLARAPKDVAVIWKESAALPRISATAARKLGKQLQSGPEPKRIDAPAPAAKGKATPVAKGAKVPADAPTPIVLRQSSPVCGACGEMHGTGHEHWLSNVTRCASNQMRRDPKAPELKRDGSCLLTLATYMAGRKALLRYGADGPEYVTFPRAPRK
jgi:hypothetical protein